MVKFWSRLEIFIVRVFRLDCTMLPGIRCFVFILCGGSWNLGEVCVAVTFGMMWWMGGLYRLWGLFMEDAIVIVVRCMYASWVFCFGYLWWVGRWN